MIKNILQDVGINPEEIGIKEIVDFIAKVGAVSGVPVIEVIGKLIDYLIDSKLDVNYENLMKLLEEKKHV